VQTRKSAFLETLVVIIAAGNLTWVVLYSEFALIAAACLPLQADLLHLSLAECC
jgi:hypothetical protein